MTDPATFRELLTPAGAAALAAAEALRPTDATFLAAYETVRKRVPDAVAKAAVETAILRAKAAGKFARAGRMYFTREALEQASHERVSQYRAERFREFATVLDIGCGIGGDAVALAATTAAIALDRDAVRLGMAEENLRANDRTAECLLRDALRDALPPCAAAFADPARRAAGQRFLGVDDYAPPPRAILEIVPHVPVAFKLAPGVPWPDLDGLGGTAEFISLHGELKECCAWVRGWGGPRRRATVLPAGATMAAAAPAACGSSEIRRYLYDPDPAVSRAGLAPNLGLELGATLPDPHGVLLTADALRPTPFAAAFRVSDVFPLKRKVVGEALKARGIGRVTPLKRGAAVDVEAWVRSWKLPGGPHAHLILTRHAAVLAEPA